MGERRQYPIPPIEFTPEQLLDIKNRRLQDGEPLDSIGRIHNASGTTIGKTLAKMGIAPRGFRRRP